MITTLTVLVCVYAGISTLFYLLQDFFFFRPEKLPSDFTFQYSFPFVEKQFDMPDGGYLNAIWFKVPNSLGVVFFLKGNSRSIKGWGKFAKDYVGKGYDFFMMDYRGFGKSRGKRSENTFYSDVEYMYNWLATQYPENKIVVLGRSLGSGFAAHVASQHHPKMLVLDSPYYSFAFQVSRFGWWLPLRWLLRYKIPTYQFLRQIQFPVYIIHGDKDFLISYEQSVRLQAENPEWVKLYTIRGGRHNNLPSLESYHKVLYTILTKEFST